jgi:putative membrane protein
MGAAVPAILIGLYLWGVARARRPWPWPRTAAALAGAVALAAALAGPIDAASDHDLAAHMLQHLLVAGIAPLLLALAAPVRLALAALPPEGRRALGRALHLGAVRVLAHPVVAVPLAAAVMVASHLTGAFELAAGSPPLHAIEHAALFWTALLAWMSILGVDPLPGTPDGVTALAWISLMMVAMTGVGVMLATDDRPRYARYPDIAEQHAGGTIMWLGGALVLVPVAVAVAMWALEREERRQRRREALE